MQQMIIFDDHSKRDNQTTMSGVKNYDIYLQWKNFPLTIKAFTGEIMRFHLQTECHARVTFLFFWLLTEPGTPNASWEHTT